MLISFSHRAPGLQEELDIILPASFLPVRSQNFLIDYSPFAIRTGSDGRAWESDSMDPEFKSPAVLLTRRVPLGKSLPF